MTTLLHGIDWFINHWIRNRDIVGTEVIPVKLVLAFTRCSASTRKRGGGERESIIFVIPDIFNRESIRGFLGWIPAYTGMTNNQKLHQDSFNIST
jgi:hypothetical protein